MPAVANDALDKVRVLQRKLYRAAKQSRSRRFHALHDKVHRRDVLQRAFEEVARNKGAAGVDGQTIDEIRQAGVEEFLSVLQAELREGTHRPLPVRRVAIPKASGGERELGIPAVRDRVVQAAVKIVIEPIFEADFCDCSFGFRPRRSARDARDRLRRHVQRERRHLVVDADIEGFFDNLDKSILMRQLRTRISDRRVLGLIERWLRAGVLAEGSLMHPETGTPQGGVISPLLANVYLNGLDRAFEERHAKLGRLVRYADDLVIVCWQPWQARRAHQALSRELAALGLRLSPSKTRIVELEVAGEGFDFLGFHFRRVLSRTSGRPYIACWPSQKAMSAARQRIRDLTPLGRIGLPAILVVQDINRFLRGWGAYFRDGNSTQQFHALDRYVFWRLARFMTRKHRRKGTGRGAYELLESRNQLGVHRLVGTVRYAPAHATGERCRRAV
jgi:RNA-directed DNA polymerase